MMGSTITRVVVGLLRRSWLVGVTTLLVCAVFAAQAVAAMFEARYLDESAVAPPPPPRVAPVTVAPPPVRDASELVTRNMFCSACTPSEPVITAGAPASPFIPAAELIATSIGRLPIATVRVPATEVQGDFGVGDAIPGIGAITRIGFSSIDVRDGEGRTGTLSLRPAVATTAAISGGRSVGGAATPVPAAAHPYSDRIRKIDDTTFEVERSVVRDLVSGSMQNAGARVMPLNKDGKLDGLRLVGVTPGKLASSLGLVNGDVLQGVNNTKIESANTLLELYAQLDKLGQVTLDGTRRGKPLTLTLRLR